MMKTINLIFALSAGFGFTISSAGAADYSSNLGSLDRNWGDIVWQPAGAPGASDTVTDITAGATRSIYLNGNQTLGELRKTTNTNIRFFNGAMDSGNAAAASTFNIGTLNVLRGGYLFRSQGTESLTVNVDIVKVGDPDAPASPQPPAGGLTIGTTASSPDVRFTVANRTELYNRANLLIEHSSSVYPTVNLGHLIYSNTSSETAQIWVGPTSGATNPSLRVKASSLSTVGSPSGSGANLLRGTGVLELTGNLDDPNHPGGANGVSVFEGLIQDNLRLEKTGSDIQILSRAGGNTYGGGTLISNGVLSIRSAISSGLGRGEVLVTGQGTLAGSGVVVPLSGNEIIVRNGGRLAPSADLSTTPQTLRLNGINHGSSTLLRAEEGARFAFNFFDGGNDQIAFLNYKIGNFLIDAADGVWVDISGEIGEGTFTLFTFHQGNESSALVAGGLTNGLLLGQGFDGYTATFHYDSVGYGGVGTISLELQAIPEPGHVALLLVAGATWAFAAIVRKRRVSYQS